MFFFFLFGFFFFLEKLAHGRFDILTSIHTYPTNYLYLYAPYAIYAIYDFNNQIGLIQNAFAEGLLFLGI